MTHKNKLKHFSFSVLAGSITGAIECLITYPLEYLKTVMQLYPKLNKKGFGFTFKDTYRKFGSFGVYRGMSSLLVFCIPKMAVRFGSKEFSNQYVFTGTGPMYSLLGGVFAGCSEAILVRTVMDTVKVKMIHDRLTARKYKGLIDGLRQMTAKHGIRSIYKGLTPGLLKYSLNQGSRFLVFDQIILHLKTTNIPTHFQRAIAGAVAGGISVIVNQPVDVIKTNV